ncbi:GTP-binding protein [Peptoniphilus asaccharolyticus DSM 20463]|uniref:Large ribosomal subunit assembly factor BipA n=1 Tax=Peptoniphilus asaccharolyticus DSM 20463 TaxID=573058 RepID=A0A1W1VKV7_PEPAS|nr:translational GTPase TypA [Peptoniphilus asaccharolyticus]MBL7574435.1 translational GTPase TypA [Peptoniphilus asaccharolyticus]SMB93691.1 GTP-binding protein [Peptoniphilus asaccharolyticus DSM 20463]
MNKREDIRNIAIIAHVDHGKTTLVDALLKQSGIFRENQVVEERVMDSNDIERERGITILSKNTSVIHNGVKINIIDTPGHADFGGEVERVLKMVNGVVLLVDAFEGPMPQTKFVLKKAFELDLPVIVAINKIDRPGARPEAVVDEVLDLFIDLGASDDALESPHVFTSAKSGIAKINLEDETTDMSALFNTIIEYIPAPDYDVEAPFQVLISTIDYNDYVGRIGVGKVERGQFNQGDTVVIVNKEKPELCKKVKITNIYEYEGLERVSVDTAKAGSIVAVTGIEDINIGDTIASTEDPTPLEFVKISEPTLAMNFSVNDSPFAGRDGKFVTSRQIRARLLRELQTDVGLRVEDTDSTDSFKVSGRGELHLSVLIENMRREGYEFQISKPEVLFKTIDGKLHEPMEIVTIDVSNEHVGSVIEKLGRRKAELVSMQEPTGGYAKLEFKMPARGLIGYRSEFMSDTKGNGILNTLFLAYEPYKGDIPRRMDASIVSFDTGTASAYGLNNAQSRGDLFVKPSEEVYEGQVVGQSPKGVEIEVSVTKTKKQSNVRASGADDALKLSPTVDMSLEEALEFIEDDELIEVTPLTFRIRKKILNSQTRYKSKKNK